MTADVQPTEASALRALATTVVKQGVHLGLLSAPAQAQVLALVWAGLPDQTMTEPQVNQALQAQLATAACFLDTDHVELRRWLVDAGWLQRDGYGRAYQRRACPDMPAEQAALAHALQDTDTVAWVTSQQASHAAARAARRSAWLGRGAPAAASAPGLPQPPTDGAAPASPAADSL